MARRFGHGNQLAAFRFAIFKSANGTLWVPRFVNCFHGWPSCEPAWTGPNGGPGTPQASLSSLKSRRVREQQRAMDGPTNPTRSLLENAEMSWGLLSNEAARGWNSGGICGGRGCVTRDRRGLHLIPYKLVPVAKIRVKVGRRQGCRRIGESPMIKNNKP